MAYVPIPGGSSLWDQNGGIAFDQPMEEGASMVSNVRPYAQADFDRDFGTYQSQNAPITGYDGLTAYNDSTQFTRGLRGEVGGENAVWMIDPKTGQEIPMISGPGGRYRLDDLIKKYGSLEAAQQALAPGDAEYNEDPLAYLARGGVLGPDGLPGGRTAFDFAGFSARPSNDTNWEEDIFPALQMFAAAYMGGYGGEAGTAGTASSTAAGTAGFEGGAATYGGTVGAGATSAATSMPPAVFDRQAVAGMSTGVGGGMMPAAIPESGNTLSEFASANPAFIDTSGFGGDFDVSGFDPNFGAFPNSGNGSFNIDTSGFGSSFDASAGFGPPGSGGGWENWMDEWRKKLMTGKGMRGVLGVGSGLYGLQQARQMEKLSQQAMSQDAAPAAERAYYAAKLRELYANPSAVDQLPGFKAGLTAVERKMAAQGYNMSGNMALALKDYGENAFNTEANRLSQLATAGSGNSNTNAAITARASASAQRGSSLASLAFGLSNFF